MRKNYLEYASYVILDRAIPDAIDGLKPVQRRILHTLFTIDDSKLHKVANVAGQTMAYHPHGDAPITSALVNLANKGYLLDMQGNFGNIYTGDPAAASRYIETRLSSLAKETLFNKAITKYISSYDGRNQEPVCLPAKIPLVLLQGAEGIAVGMSTRILPHNFNELLKAQIAILQKKPYEVWPDFPTGGLIDASDYQKGRGKVKVRAKLDIVDTKTIIVREICPGTTTESLINSVDEAAKKGRLKIESINDYTSDKVEIEIKLPRGHYATDILDALYAFTDCEVSLSSQILVVKDKLPWETDVHELLELHTKTLKSFLKQELELARDSTLRKVFEKTLEQIFIENRMYKKIETIKTYPKIHETIALQLKPFHRKLTRAPTYEDREKLLNIPIRRISKFDFDRHLDEIKKLKKELLEIEKNLKRLTHFTVLYIENLLKKYGDLFPRKTVLKTIQEIDRKKAVEKQIKVGIDYEKGFVGTKISSSQSFTCSNLDKIVLFFNDGTYQVINPSEKDYVHRGNRLLWVAPIDKDRIMSCIYKDPKTKYAYAKRFTVSKFILKKVYSFIEKGMQLELLTADPSSIVYVHFVPKPKLKQKKITYSLDDVAVKGVSAKGKRIASKEVKKISLTDPKNQMTFC
ncbi:MAG: DNA gyrase subunit A [Chlamydiae bacterium]|nr:DNA gyrase subunit A [Chlamydiota bacterium]